MSLSECLTNIRNLEGIIDFENCIYFAGKKQLFYGNKKG